MRDVAACDELTCDRLGRAEMAKPTPVPVDGAAAVDLVVDAYHMPARVEQRAAGVAVIDRRVGLNRIWNPEPVWRLDVPADRTTIPAVIVLSRPNGLPIA